MGVLSADTSDANRSVGTTEKEHCNPGDLMGTLGLFIQALLAFLAFTSLIVKRYCEPIYERRPWKIWFYDTSKQGFGAAVIHFANVFLADMFQGDPCTWYFISFILDSTIGIVVIYLGLKFTQILVRHFNCLTLKFGEYGSPPQCSAWVGQCGLYILVMIIEKILMTLLVQFSFWKDVYVGYTVGNAVIPSRLVPDGKTYVSNSISNMYLSEPQNTVRNFLMSPIKDPHVELVIVMFIVPLVVNAFIFWVVDNFLKGKFKGTKTIYVSENDPSVKYSKTRDEVRYYNRIERAEDLESDLIGSTDEEFDLRHRAAVEGTQKLLA